MCGMWSDLVSSVISDGLLAGMCDHMVAWTLPPVISSIAESGTTLMEWDVPADQAALVAHGMVLAATSQWSGLDPLESGLLTHLVPVFAPTGMCDVPIYLPISSPTTPVRLLVAELAPGKPQASH